VPLPATLATIEPRVTVVVLVVVAVPLPAPRASSSAATSATMIAATPPIHHQLRRGERPLRAGYGVVAMKVPFRCAGNWAARPCTAAT
jgi:hypothetical protein